MKNVLEEINNKLDEAEDLTSDLEDKVGKKTSNQSIKKKKQFKKMKRIVYGTFGTV